MDNRGNFLKNTAAAGIAGITAAGVIPANAQKVRSKREVSLEEARAVHKKCLIIDGHNDSPVERVARKENPLNWKQRDMNYHTDIPRMKESGQYTGFFIVGNGPIANVWVTTERVLQHIKAYSGDLMQVLTSQDAVRAGKSGKVGVMLSIEGIGPWIDGKIEIIPILYRLGVRSMGITHGEGGKEQNQLQGTRSRTGVCTLAEREDIRKNADGLTPLGFEVLKREEEMGIIVDLSHINDKAFFQVLEQGKNPPVMSHTAVFSRCNQGRCLTDDQIKALAAKGGVMGICFVTGFLNPEPGKATIDNIVEHILYAADLVGSIDHIGIGSDYDGTKGPLLPDVSQLVQLTRCMMQHGLTDEEIRKIWGGNFLRVFQKVIDRT
jgi:membrane dipeptidase